MTEAIRNHYTPDIVTPPGETLLEILEERNMSQAELASRTGRPTKTINEIIKGKAAITPETALQLELVLGVPATFWNNRERGYREYLAKKKEGERLGGQVDWIERFPYHAMSDLGWIPRSHDKASTVQHLFMFFGVASSSSWDDLWNHHQAAFRQSHAFSIDSGAVVAWLRKGEHEASEIECKAYDESRFRDALTYIRALTRDLPRNFSELVVKECGDAGVCVVFVPELPRTRVWGATRWLTSSCALIQLSLRYKSEDHLWFTFFHEAAHVLLHGKKDLFIETDSQTKDRRESEADEFSRDWLIPPDSYKSFRRRGARSCDAIRRFAYELGIAAGIVVGRLQHDGVLPRTHCNTLKRQISWSEEKD